MNKKEIDEVRRLLKEADEEWERFISTPEGKAKLDEYVRKHSHVSWEELNREFTI